MGTARWSAVVTGGGSGIGAALAVELGRRRDGVVVVADVDETRAREVADRVRERGGTAVATRLDVTDGDAVRDLVERTDRETPLRTMFNNAGVGGTLPFHEATPAHWDRIIALNLRAVIDGTAAAYAVMARRGAGHIVNTASVAGLMPVPMQTLYNTTKFGVVGLSLSLRPEAALRGVRVTVVCPGDVATDIWRHPLLGPSAAAAAAPPGAVPADAAARIILRGMRANRARIVFPRPARRLERAFRLGRPAWARWAASKVGGAAGGGGAD